MPYEPPAAYAKFRELFMSFIRFVVFNKVCAAIYVQLCPEWKFVDAVYHSFMTATTIGLGEIAPHTQGGRAFGIFHMAVAVQSPPPRSPDPGPTRAAQVAGGAFGAQCTTTQIAALCCARRSPSCSSATWSAPSSTRSRSARTRPSARR